MKITYYFRVATAARYVCRQVTVSRTRDAEADIDAALTILYRRHPGARVSGVK